MKTSKARDRKGSEKNWKPITCKYQAVLSLNLAMCQLEMGFAGKALSIIGNLEKTLYKRKSEDLWNCKYKKGIVYDREGAYELSV